MVLLAVIMMMKMMKVETCKKGYPLVFCQETGKLPYASNCIWQWEVTLCAAHSCAFRIVPVMQTYYYHILLYVNK